MACQTRMSMIQPPITYVYAVFFIIGGIFAITANLLVLVILWLPGQRTRSNKILTSLALSDFLVGCIVFPITGYQLLDHSSLSSCDVDFSRGYFHVLLQGASCLTLGVVSYDRYILITKFQIYERKSTKRLMVVLIFISWLVPGITPFLRWVGRLPYLLVSIAILIVPFVVLIFNYFYITYALKRQEKLLKQSYSESMRMNREPLAGDSGDENSVHVSSKATYRKQRSHIKLAKTVTVLILAYFICVTPVQIWFILNLVNSIKPFISAFSHQNLYLFAVLAVSWNSVFNPIIYFAKNKEIRKGLKKIFGIKQNNGGQTEPAISYTNSSSLKT